jgi:hypothetical protein
MRPISPRLSKQLELDLTHQRASGEEYTELPVPAPTAAALEVFEHLEQARREVEVLFGGSLAGGGAGRVPFAKGVVEDPGPMMRRNAGVLLGLPR